MGNAREQSCLIFIALLGKKSILIMLCLPRASRWCCVEHSGLSASLGAHVATIADLEDARKDIRRGLSPPFYNDNPPFASPQ